MELRLAIACVDDRTLSAKLINLLLVLLDKLDQLSLLLDQEVVLLLELLVELLLEQIHAIRGILVLALVHGLVDRLL